MIAQRKIVTLLLMLFVGFSYAQVTLTGTITNYKGKPVSNTLVYLDSINSGVKTNKKGFYSVEVPTNIKEINVYSYKYGLLSSEIQDKQIINFVYLDKKKAKKDKVKKGDMVSLAYSEIEKKYVVSSIPVIDPEKQTDLINYTSIYDLMRGRLAGVVVTQDNRIRIRGVNSPNSTSEPLFIVDGTPVFTIDNILPMNVKDIKILKGSDTAIYGSRGANGVIIITTKT